MVDEQRVWIEFRQAARRLGFGFLVAAALCALFVGFYVLGQKDAEDAAAFNRYVTNHKCGVVETRTRTEYRTVLIGKLITRQPYTVTEHLWRCDNGEFWR